MTVLKPGILLKKPGRKMPGTGSEPGQGQSPGNVVPPTVAGAPLR